MGNNLNGKLGYETKFENQRKPKEIDFFRDKFIQQITVGLYHTFVLTCNILLN